MSREVVVVSAVRTAIGTFGGGLKDVPPCTLAASVVRESLARAQVEGDQVGHVGIGVAIAFGFAEAYAVNDGSMV